MSLATSLKRVLTAIGALALALGVAIAAIPFLLPAERLREAVIGELQGRLGMPIAIAGSVSVVVFPRLAVRLDGLKVGHEPEFLITADHVSGALSLLSLATGRVAIGEYEFIRPRLAVRVASDGASNWDRALEAIRRLPREAVAGLPSLRFIDGAAAIVFERGNLRFDLTDIDLSVAWPTIERPATISGTVRLRGETFEIGAVVSQPIALASGDPSAMRLRFSGPPARFAFDGALRAGADTRANGTLSMESPSLRAMLRWLGTPVGPGGGLGPMALKGETTITPGLLVFARANVELDGNVAEGALSVTFGGPRPQVQGTLDAGRIVATPYVAERAAMGVGGWSKESIDFGLIAAFDADLRLSARELIAGRMTLGRSALAVLSRNGRLTITLGEAVAHGGVIRGALTLSHAGDAGAEVRVSFGIQRIQVAPAFGEWFGFRRMEGLANAQGQFETRGGSIDEFVRGLNGQVTLAAVEGAITGVNAEAILRRLERRPLAAAGADARAGRTPFERLIAQVRVVNGLATAEDLVMDGPIVRVALEGAAQMPTRDLDFRGMATLKRQAVGATGGNFDLPFVVQGSWDDPFILPDPDALIRRSGAAAPLRDLTRDRDALRAVTDAINRSVRPDGTVELPPVLPSLAPIHPTIRP